MSKVFLFVPLLLLASFSFASVEKPAAVAKELVFPIAGKSSIGSHWGDARDGGARKHEGIDIFAEKGTPVVAVTDGYVLDVSEDGIGGKTVTIQSDNYNWRTYYAHLDEQIVRSGQIIKKGQVIGTVGNTGNARTTPPHLHFGMYENYEAFDPLPYVKSAPKISKPVKNDEVVYKQTKSTSTAGKSNKSTTNKKPKIAPAIETAAVTILTGILRRKIKL
jgi:murein DD-endopeptidase MepM/ murein hydrolase activator NlpD